jgi:ketosteroid isomerase-like protein
MRSLIAFTLAVAAFVSTFGDVASASQPATERDMTALLTQSAYYWNHGNLDAFMQSYENSPDTAYVNSKTVIHGYANIRAHYAEHYGRSGMGALSFSGLSVRPLGPDYAVVVAHWHLAMRGGAHSTGIFSLVLHRGPSGWRIITDHSP